jgi:hypothetical protein
MKYREVRMSLDWNSARIEVMTAGIKPGRRYWHMYGSLHSTTMLYLCAKRGDPFAQRIWALTTAGYLKRCATAG